MMRRIQGWLLVGILVLAMSVLPGCSPGSGLNGAIDPDDVTPGVQNGAPLNGVWYGDLDITRYDQGPQPVYVVEAFYLDLTLRTDQSIIGTYTTCPKDMPVTMRGLAKYDLGPSKLENGSMLYLAAFIVLHGSVSGNTMTIFAMQYKPHLDDLTETYHAVLHKVDRSSFLSACQIISG